MVNLLLTFPAHFAALVKGSQAFVMHILHFFSILLTIEVHFPDFLDRALLTLKVIELR